MVVGRLLSYWGQVTFQGRTVKLPGGKSSEIPLVCNVRNVHTEKDDEATIQEFIGLDSGNHLFLQYISI